MNAEQGKIRGKLWGKTVTFGLAIGLVGGLSFGCASARTLKRVEIGKQSMPRTALMLDVRFETRDELILGKDCQLTFRNLEQGTDYSVMIPGQGGTVVVEAAPGRHAFKEIYCYRSKAWMISMDERNYWIVPVRSGKLNYAGLIELIERPEEHVLSFRWSETPASGLPDVLTGLPKTERNRAVASTSGAALFP